MIAQVLDEAEGPAHVPNRADFVLQALILPDLAISTEFGLYLHSNGHVLPRPETNEILFQPGGEARFDTYMNLFNLGTWTRHCRLPELALRLRGTGRFDLHIRHISPDMTPTMLLEQTVELSLEGLRLDLSHVLAADPVDAGLITLRLTAQTEGRLAGGAFLTSTPAEPLPDSVPLRLAIAITTFRREADVAQTVRRITGFLDAQKSAWATDVHLFVVDNGQTLALPPHPRLTVIPNTNLGGAGGFARGLAAAQDGNFSHCLFMDDDASFEMENLTRTLAFLRLARSPRAALAGAMISAARPWAMWENGAVFDRLCRPRFIGTDLRDPADVAEMELAASLTHPPGFYGGWWYFAFPVAEVRHFPFPFFVRGDDISFSLAHRFDTATLNGVVSFQEDFSAKESPLTLYLDMRNHLHHHMVQEGMEIGSTGTLKILWRFLLRSIVRMHYDSAEAQLMAIEDVMRGPTFFADNADMQAKRPEVNALTRTEAWQSVAYADLPPRPPVNPVSGRRELIPPGRLKVLAMKYSLNGHLIPFWGRIGRHARIPVAQRGLLWTLWGVTKATFVDAEETRAYTVHHDKRRFATIMKRALQLSLRWRKGYLALRQAYRDSYGPMTSSAFWEGRFLQDRPLKKPNVEAAE